MAQKVTQVLKAPEKGARIETVHGDVANLFSCSSKIQIEVSPNRRLNEPKFYSKSGVGRSTHVAIVVKMNKAKEVSLFLAYRPDSIFCLAIEQIPIVERDEKGDQIKTMKIVIHVGTVLNGDDRSFVAFIRFKEKCFQVSIRGNVSLKEVNNFDAQRFSKLGNKFKTVTKFISIK